MPSDYYIKLDGVKGESQASDMTDNIEVQSWSFGVSNPASLGGKGLAAGKASLSDFTFGCDLDSSSYQVVSNLTKGTHIKEVVFTGRKTGGGGTPYKYLVITMNNCYVTGFSTGGGSEGVPSVNISIAFDTIKYQYYTQDTVSGSVSLAGEANYDIKQVKAS